MSRALDDLHEKFKPKVIEFLARLTEAGICVLIVETKRSEAQHKLNLAKGVSWTERSKHIDGLAIDIVPYETYQAKGEDKLNWDINDPVWFKIASIGKGIGMLWGGDWKQKDMGHFEYMGGI